MKSIFAAVLLFLAGIFGGNHATPPPPTSTAAAAVAESQPAAPAVTPPAPQTTAPAQVIADATVSHPQAPAATRPAAATLPAVLTVPIDPDYVTPSQLAAALSELQSSINQEIDSSTSTLAYGGLQNEISALARINSLSPSQNAPLTISGATITNANLTASEIPALSYLPLTGGAVTGTTTIATALGIGTTSPISQLALSNWTTTSGFSVNDTLDSSYSGAQLAVSGTLDSNAAAGSDVAGATMFWATEGTGSNLDGLMLQLEPGWTGNCRNDVAVTAGKCAAAPADAPGAAKLRKHRD